MCTFNLVFLLALLKIFLKRLPSLQILLWWFHHASIMLLRRASMCRNLFKSSNLQVLKNWVKSPGVEKLRNFLSTSLVPLYHKTSHYSLLMMHFPRVTHYWSVTKLPIYTDWKQSHGPCIFVYPHAESHLHVYIYRWNIAYPPLNPAYIYRWETVYPHAESHLHVYIYRWKIVYPPLNPAYIYRWETVYLPR